MLPSGSDSPTVAGASLEVVNPTTGESAILAMPAAGWTVLASGALRYRDPSQTMGPVRVALRRAGRLAKVVARGSGIGFTLDEPAQGSLAAELQSGTRRYCTLFGGRVRRDQPGRFTAVRAPAPSACVR